MNAAVPRPAVPLPFDLERIRADFPILSEPVRGGHLAYLDNGATTQKPESVLRAMDHYYRHQNSNVHRAIYDLAERATSAPPARKSSLPAAPPRRSTWSPTATCCRASRPAMKSC